MDGSAFRRRYLGHPAADVGAGHEGRGVLEGVLVHHDQGVRQGDPGGEHLEGIKTGKKLARLHPSTRHKREREREIFLLSQQLCCIARNNPINTNKTREIATGSS